MAAIPRPPWRDRGLVANSGSKTPMHIDQAREVIRSIADRISAAPGEDGVPVAELAPDPQIADRLEHVRRRRIGHGSFATIASARRGSTGLSR